jgi:hypothetical protein
VSASHFKPAYAKAHARAARGENVQDYCINCGAEFMEHTNGVCPEPEPEEDEDNA